MNEARTPILEYVSEVWQWGDDRGKPVPGVMQVVKQGDKTRMVDFLCPCGCGHTCPTFTVEDDVAPNDRRWTFHDGPDGPTLHPSIRWTGGCKAHFFIKNGKVEFCADSGK